NSRHIDALPNLSVDSLPGSLFLLPLRLSLSVGSRQVCPQAATPHGLPRGGHVNFTHIHQRKDPLLPSRPRTSRPVVKSANLWKSLDRELVRKVNLMLFSHRSSPLP